MRKAYQVIAWVICALVVVQAGAMALAVSGESKFIDDGGVIDKALVESAQEGGEPPFSEAIGFMIHGMNGMMLLPLVGLVFLGVSFAAGFARARMLAAVVLLLIAIQIFMGLSASGLPILGLLHGMNALLIFATAMYAARLAGRPATPSAVTPSATQTQSV
jgi:heme A synthase